MTDDRSRPERGSGRPPAGEGWLDRLLDLIPLRSRESAREDLEDALAETGEASFSLQERTMLRNVLEFHKIRVDDAMVPRADIVAVSADCSLGEVLGRFRTAGHSRLPVYGETLDDPSGMVHIRDFLDYLARRAEADQPPDPGQAPNLGKVDLSISLAEADILRPVLYVPRSMPAIDLLVRMQATRTHIALVIDEYGGTDGLVSIEDLVEMVVGNIEDEHDVEEERTITAAEDGAFVADARVALEDVSEAVGVDLAHLASAEEIDTLAGFIVTLAGRVPPRGEVIPGPSGLEFEVLDADPRRLKRVRIHRRDGAEAPGAPAVPASIPPPGAPAAAKPDASAA